MKEKCKCGKVATWIKMSACRDEYPFYCDECVPRGCSCNSIPVDDDWGNFDEDNWIQETDELGRELPCCEFDYEGDGFDKN